MLWHSGMMIVEVDEVVECFPVDRPIKVDVGGACCIVKALCL